MLVQSVMARRDGHACEGQRPKATGSSPSGVPGTGSHRCLCRPSWTGFSHLFSRGDFAEPYAQKWNGRQRIYRQRFQPIFQNQVSETKPAQREFSFSLRSTSIHCSVPSSLDLSWWLAAQGIQPGEILGTIPLPGSTVKLARGGVGEWRRVEVGSCYSKRGRSMK